jgi:DNA-binding LytR/AlgR family response regulator
MQRTAVTASYRGSEVSWPVNEITHFTYSHKYATAHHLAGGELLLQDSLVQLEQEFSALFIRTHRAYLVARHLITKVNWESVIVEGVGKLPLSRRVGLDFKRRVAQ